MHNQLFTEQLEHRHDLQKYALSLDFMKSLSRVKERLQVAVWHMLKENMLKVVAFKLSVKVNHLRTFQVLVEVQLVFQLTFNENRQLGWHELTSPEFLRAYFLVEKILGTGPFQDGIHFCKRRNFVCVVVFVVNLLLDVLLSSFTFDQVLYTSD